jgi:hypothetical protein
METNSGWWRYWITMEMEREGDRERAIGVNEGMLVAWVVVTVMG